MDIVEQLEKLKALKEKGVLSESDYEYQRKLILDKLTENSVSSNRNNQSQITDITKAIKDVNQKEEEKKFVKDFIATLIVGCIFSVIVFCDINKNSPEKYNTSQTASSISSNQTANSQKASTNVLPKNHLYNKFSTIELKNIGSTYRHKQTTAIDGFTLENVYECPEGACFKLKNNSNQLGYIKLYTACYDIDDDGIKSGHFFSPSYEALVTAGDTVILRDPRKEKNCDYTIGSKIFKDAKYVEYDVKKEYKIGGGIEKQYNFLGLYLGEEHVDNAVEKYELNLKKKYRFDEEFEITKVYGGGKEFKSDRLVIIVKNNHETSKTIRAVLLTLDSGIISSYKDDEISVAGFEKGRFILTSSTEVSRFKLFLYYE